MQSFFGLNQPGSKEAQPLQLRLLPSLGELLLCFYHEEEVQKMMID